ncbi:MAG: hypothetical protein OXQ31_17670 [Spirochaetaceae bacterium]|nr:hypothetical protein [Spirochaetaceae bacterium]
MSAAAGSAAGMLEGAAVEERFEVPARAELVVKGSFFSLDITGYEGDVIAGRAVMSERVRRRNGVSIVTRDGPEQVTVEVVTNDRNVLRSSLLWYPQIRLRVPHGVSVAVTAAGDLILQSLEAPSADLYTFEGDIIVRDVTAELFTTNAAGVTRVFDSDGPKWLLSSDGDIAVDGGTGDVRVQTIGGRLTLRGVAGDVVTNVAVEDIRIEGLDGTITHTPAPVKGEPDANGG